MDAFIHEGTVEVGALLEGYSVCPLVPKNKASTGPDKGTLVSKVTVLTRDPQYGQCSSNGEEETRGWGTEFWPDMLFHFPIDIT